MSRARRFLWLGLLAALCGPASLARAEEPPLGRLFHTPAERKELDEMRRLGPRNMTGPRPVLRLDGLVRHPDGRTTAWINGQPVAGGEIHPQHSAGRAAIRTQSGKAVVLGVGDQVSTGRDSLEPLLQDGHVRRNPR